MSKHFLSSLLAILLAAYVQAQPFDSKYFNAMQWRMIGPHRGGRTVGATGVPQQPNTFYIGVNNGGVWKTTDFGRTWFPIFDDQPTGSVGDVMVAPSNPNIIYVGSGEGIQRPDLSTGDGIYKSSDAGKTWTNVGLKDAQQIGGLAIDPVNENKVFVAALGHPYGPNKERGVYRTTDGGKTWQQVLYIDENTGAIQVTIDPKNPNIVFADMWAGRQGPWENGSWNGKESGLFKSTDGGSSWKKITKGLPTTEQGLGRIGFCIAPSDDNRMYATVDAGKYGGIYRSDDAGESWTNINSDQRFWGRGSDFAEVKVDPKNPDIVYSANVVTWKSIDAGKTWDAFRGAPGGDDYHRIWINPDNPEIILIASDQGAIITVNGGQTFSSWYNQPTAQFYHVSTDNAFPYNVYGGQQESGSVGIASRGNDGAITFREWHPVGVEEYGYVAVDPLDPNIIYGGKISRYDKRTGQTQNISPEAVRSGKNRFIRTAPVLFNPIDNKTLYFAGNVLFKTMNGGQSWQVISPDLTRETYDIPESVGIYESLMAHDSVAIDAKIKVSPEGIGRFVSIVKDLGSNNDVDYKDAIVNKLKTMQFDKADHESIVTVRFDFKPIVNLPRRGVIYTVAPSYKGINTIWCGTDDGFIQVTRDGGKNWKNVTPPAITSWSKVSLMDASHFDVNTAYAAVNRIRCDDMHPYIYKTNDGGKTWKEIVNGLPDDPINVIREDPKRKGLLYAGSERAVYVSFDEGEHWQSLRLNMPATSIRDLVIKDGDLIIGTHGRSFWILDDITALRQLSNQLANQSVIFYQPQTAYRVRWNMGTDTPVPQEEPAGQNPPDGAVINYYLKDAKHELTLEISDKKNNLIRKYSSLDTLYNIPADNTPAYWIRPQQILSSKEGAHRFIWDMHYQPLNLPASYPIAATYMNTAPDPTSPWVMPGYYTAQLTVDGQTFTQTFTVKMDPRVKISVSDLQKQHDLSVQCYEGRKQSMKILEEIRLYRLMLRGQMTNPALTVADELNKKDKEAELLENNPSGSNVPSFRRFNNFFASLFALLQDSDRPPTAQTVAALAETQKQLKELLKKWNEIKTR